MCFFPVCLFVYANFELQMLLVVRRGTPTLFSDTSEPSWDRGQPTHTGLCVRKWRVQSSFDGYQRCDGQSQSKVSTPSVCSGVCVVVVQCVRPFPTTSVDVGARALMCL